MKNIFDAVVAALNPLKSEDISLTVAGNAKSGNRNVRVHYKTENLLSKVLYRDDLSKLGPESEAVKQYISNLNLPTHQPWTSLPGENQVKLVDILRAAQVDRDLFLPASSDVAETILKTYSEYPRTHAFIRQWTARGKGVGLELVVIFQDGEQFAVYEGSLNFYIEPNVDKIIRQLKESKAAGKDGVLVVDEAGNPVEVVKEAGEETKA